MKEWFRPSIQQPRWIKQIVDKAFAPIITVVSYGKDYWETWNNVYKPERKDDKK